MLKARHELLDREIPADTKTALEVFSVRHLVRRIILVSLALVAVAFISWMLGRYTALPSQIYQAVVEYFTVPESEYADLALHRALFNIRLPRIIVVILVGMALSVAGAAYQGMFKNPLVSPDLLGASAGAALGACLALLWNLSNIYIQAFAFIGGILAVSLVLLINRVVKADAILGLILGGILVGSLFQSGTSIIKLVADADGKLPSITFWLMGSFASISLKDLLMILPVMLVGYAVLLTQSWNLNVLSFGEDEAKSLGINTGRTRLIVIAAATLLTSCSVAVSGMIGWIGLVVPHLTRAIVGPNYRVLLPTTMLVGGLFLLIVDNFARLLFEIEIPIGLLTSILGVPFFIFIYRKNMKGW
ncbi:MAG: iron ABC transporter permease [Coriobacteriales bacterium]|jgi:iron complex transport system permease protein|nr:iron ABC transporter permease [Coriobacteriales bacterium]